MSNFNIEFFLNDFAKRTITNLQYIEKGIENEQSLYEVSQLMNSLFGLLIVPYESQKNMSDEKLKNISEKDYDAVREIIELSKKRKNYFCNYKERNEKNTVQNFIRHMRNSIAHSGNKGIHFYPIAENKDISEIIFYDCLKDERKTKNVNNKTDNNVHVYEFCVKISVEELRKLIFAVNTLYCGFEKKESQAEKKREKYNEDISRLTNLMNNGKRNRNKTIFEE